MTTLALWAIRLYRAGISPLFPAVCRYYPSCAAFSEEAIHTHGWRRGCWLGIKRIIRCRPFGRHGFDPVPPVAPSRARRS